MKRERSSEPAARASKLNRKESRRSGEKGHCGPDHRAAAGARRRRVLLRPVRLGGAGSGSGSGGAGRGCCGCGGDESDLGDEARAGGADDSRGRLDERIIFGVVVAVVVVVVIARRSRVLGSLDVCRKPDIAVSMSSLRRERRGESVGIERERTGIFERLAEARSDRLHLELAGVDHLGQYIVDREVDRLLIKIVREDDEPVREGLNGVVEERVEVVVRLSRRDDAAADLPVAGVKDLAVVLGPDDRPETHLQRNVPDTVVDVAVRRTESLVRKG